MSIPSDIKIEPCPVCGQVNDTDENVNHEYGGTGHFLRCDCGFETLVHPTIAEAAAQWNGLSLSKRLSNALNALASLVMWKRADDVWVARTGSASHPIYGYGATQVDAILALATEVQP